MAGQLMEWLAEWLFVIVFGSLSLATFVLCPKKASTPWQPLGLSLDAAGRRELGRFLRSQEQVPDARLAPYATAWAETVAEPDQCRWSRYLAWAWALWIIAGAGLAVAFGTIRDVALHLIFLDVMLLFIAILQSGRRRAYAVLEGVGRPPPRI